MSGTIAVFETIASGLLITEYDGPPGVAGATGPVGLTGPAGPAGATGAAGGLAATYLNPINNTSASSDLMLSVDQIAYLDISGATSVPLYIATGDNQEYQINGDFSVPGTDAYPTSFFLKPNNATYSGAFTFAGAGYGPAGSGFQSAISQNGLIITIQGSPSSFKSILSTKTISKTLTSRFNDGNQAALGDAWWNDTSTVYSSMGTLVSPYALTGRIWIRRIG